MRFRYTILYVENVKNALTFYANAFGLDIAFLHDSGDYGELETGNTRLAFSSRQLMRNLGKQVVAPDPEHPLFEIAFETDDVDAALAKATAAGATKQQAARDEPWGQRTAYIIDPEGYLVEICSPVSPPP